MRPPSPIEPEGLFDGLRFGPIALGAMVDVGTTILASTLLLAWFAPELFRTDDAEATRETLTRLYESSAFVAANVALGAFCTLLGAYIGAQRAGRLFVRHGGWIAVLSTALGSLLMLMEPANPNLPEPSYPIWAEVLSWILILPSGVLGGALAGAVARRLEGHR